MGDEKYKERVLRDIKRSIHFSTTMNIFRLLLVLSWTIAFCFLDMYNGDTFFKLMTFIITSVILIESIMVCLRNFKIKSLIYDYRKEEDMELKNMIFNKIYIQVIFASLVGVNLEDGKNAYN